MTLRPADDLTVADWFLHADAAWHTLATQGPPGFDAYTTVWFGTGEPDEPTDTHVFREVMRMVADHTTPVWFGVWNGYGEGVPFVRKPAWMPLWLLLRIQRTRTPRPKRPDLPTVSLRGYRDFWLYTGTPADGLAWEDFPPAICWPDDRSWFIASDVDPDYLTVGSSAELAAALQLAEGLRAEPAEYGNPPAESGE